MIEKTAGADKAIDGRTDENSCAMLPFIAEPKGQTWWKLWLPRKFNIAYIEIYFSTISKYREKVTEGNRQKERLPQREREMRRDGEIESWG